MFETIELWSTLQSFFAVICFVFVIYFLVKQFYDKNKLMKNLQFIGWLRDTNKSRPNYYLWFHMINRTFLFSPMQLANSFYTLKDHETIKHRSRIHFGNKEFEIILKGRH